MVAGKKDQKRKSATHETRIRLTAHPDRWEQLAHTSGCASSFNMRQHFPTSLFNIRHSPTSPSDEWHLMRPASQSPFTASARTLDLPPQSYFAHVSSTCAILGLHSWHSWPNTNRCMGGDCANLGCNITCWGNVFLSRLQSEVVHMLQLNLIINFL